jgi:radical SAM protein with 4Fe4S-binding SPASM domain
MTAAGDNRTVTALPWPVRIADEDDFADAQAVHVVWEITLACNLGCSHCGSRAGLRRPDELTTAECLALIDQLPSVGTRHVTLIGGEAFLRRDWLELIRAIRAQEIGCSMQSGGLHLTRSRLEAAADAGLQSVGLSLDGFPDLHDELRGRKGSFAAAVSALEAAAELGLSPSVNTQLTRGIVPYLRDFADFLMDHGVRSWQVQLTVPAGRAADRPELIVQPFDLVELMPMLADIFRAGVARGMLVQPGNNIGFFGPYEEMWRGFGAPGVHYVGCNAGITGFGIEADGTIKGCPSLSTELYAAGSVRDTPLKELVRLSRVRQRAPAPSTEVWGRCAQCYYASVCDGGCTWMASSLSGRAGNNPYCHHRALDLRRVGLRERVTMASAAPGLPFDHAMFKIHVEEVSRPAGDAAIEVSDEDTAARLAELPSWAGREAPSDGGAPSRIPEQLEACGRCRRHVFGSETVCPHCDADLAAAQRERAWWMERGSRIAQELLATLGR